MKRLAVVLFLLWSVAGCEQTPRLTQHYIAQGYVRSVWFDARACRSSVVFEGENGVIFTIRGERCTLPPVWQGLHAIIEYESDPDYGNATYLNLQVLKRLP